LKQAWLTSQQRCAGVPGLPERLALKAAEHPVCPVAAKHRLGRSYLTYDYSIEYCHVRAAPGWLHK
jgi:hypothetical protein